MKETTMTIRHATFTAALALASIGPTQAEGLKPLQGQVIDLGDVSRVAYHTVERDGFRVVATLAKKGEDGVRAGRGRARPRPKPGALHPARGGHPARRGRDHEARRHGARPRGGRGGHELSEGRLIGDAAKGVAAGEASVRATARHRRLVSGRKRVASRRLANLCPI